eukprot:2546737-Pyramimonas_sp.AAC.1
MHAPSCGAPAEHAACEFYWHGQGAQRAEWRDETIAIILHDCLTILIVHTRVDNGAWTYVRSPKSGPRGDHVARRATANHGNNTTMQNV